MIRVYLKTTPIVIKFLEQCIFPRIMLVSKCVFVVNINFVRHQTIRTLGGSEGPIGVSLILKTKRFSELIMCPSVRTDTYRSNYRVK